MTSSAEAASPSHSERESFEKSMRLHRAYPSATRGGAGSPMTGPAAALRIGSVRVAGLLQVLGGDVLGLLLVDVDPGVELLHDLERQALLDLLDRRLVVGTGLVGDLLVGDEDHVAGRQHALVVLEQRVLVAVDEQLRVAGEQDRQVGVALVEDLVAQPDVDRRELAELEAVVLLEPGQAVDPLAALRRAGERQILGLALRGRRSSRPRARRRWTCSRPTALRIGERGRGERGQPELRELLLALVDGLLRVGRDVLGRGVEERGQRRRRVLGIAADLAVLERLQRDLLGAEVEIGRDVVAGGLERLGVDLAEDELLGEVLRADRQLDPVVVGVVLDQVVGARRSDESRRSTVSSLGAARGEAR